MSRTLAAVLSLALIAPAAALAAPNMDPKAAPAGTYTVEKTHTAVVAKIDHQGFSSVMLRFNKVDGSYTYDPAKPDASQLKIVIDPASIDTGQAGFDAELRGERFLKADKFPTVTFVSKSMKLGADGKGTVTGDLTLMGVTKPAVLDVIYHGSAVTGKVQRTGFTGHTSIKRSAFGIMDGLGPIGDDVNFQIEIEFTKPL